MIRQYLYIAIVLLNIAIILNNVVQTNTLLPILADKDYTFTKTGEPLVACDMIGK